MKLRSEEHYQFHNEFIGLVDRYTMEVLGLGEPYPDYQSLVASEAKSLNLIRKSPVTGELLEADILRDSTIEGLYEVVGAAGKHFDAAVRQASTGVQFVLDQYDGISRKSYNEETAAIKSLVKELRDNHSAEIAAIAVDGWVTELERNNTAFETLLKDRYTEAVAKPQSTMKEMRQQVDDAYRGLVERVNALVVINGSTAYEAFVNELNERILKYKLILAQRKGRNSKVAEEEAR